MRVTRQPDLTVGHEPQLDVPVFQVVEHAGMNLRGQIIGHILRDVRDALDQEPFRIDAEEAGWLDAPMPHPFKGAIDAPDLAIPILQQINVVADRWARRYDRNLAGPPLAGDNPREVSGDCAIDVLLPRLGVGDDIDLKDLIRSADRLRWLELLFAVGTRCKHRVGLFPSWGTAETHPASHRTGMKA